jgi:uncharacterized protein (TIGR02266 family)
VDASEVVSPTPAAELLPQQATQQGPPGALLGTPLQIVDELEPELTPSLAMSLSELEAAEAPPATTGDFEDVFDLPSAPPSTAASIELPALPSLSPVAAIPPERRRLESLEARLAELEADAHLADESQPPVRPKTADIDWARLDEAQGTPAPVADSWRPLAATLESNQAPATPEAKPDPLDLLSGLDDDFGDAWSSLDIPDFRSGGRRTPAPRVRRPSAPITRVQAVPRTEPVQRPRRRELSVKVGLEHGNYFFTGFSSNISETGLFVTTHQLLDVGSRVDMFFDLPDGHSVNCVAEVRWVRPFNPNDPDSQPGMGLAFATLNHDDRVLVDRYIARKDAPIFD